MKTLPQIPIWILVSVFVLEASSTNTPPDISFDREWILTEDEPIGSVVTRVQVHDADGDEVTISIGDPIWKTFQEQEYEGSSFFLIDEEGRVKLKKSLQGMAGEKFHVSIVASDGHLPYRVEARVTIRLPNESVKFAPMGLPSSFSAGPPPPPIELIHRSTFSGKSGPPLLHLDKFTKWDVSSDAQPNSYVATVQAQDLSNTFLRFSISPHTLLNINSTTGIVSVASSLARQIGDHVIKVTASNQFNSIAEAVTLGVQSSGDEVITYVTSTSSPNTKDSTISDDSTPTITIIEEGIPEDRNTTSGSKKTLGWSVVMLVLVFGVIPLMLVGAFLLWRWRRNKKLQASAKESSVSYSEKRSRIIGLNSGHRDSIIEGLFSIVGIHKRAESNGYEENIKPPKVPNRESKKSAKSTKSNSSSKEKDKWEVPRHKLKVLGILGEGCFGQVWKCEATNLIEEGISYVAVKTLKESAGSAEHKDLKQELKVLKSLGDHPNVVSLIGCCSEKDPLFVILEYMIGGKLQSYLRSSRAGHAYDNLHGISASLTPRDLTIFALQVARGMDFLSKNGIIHRDLAARNVLVGENKICKVADFGFARDIANNHVYERKSDGRLPLRWMAPESLFDNIFTPKSDVWSFGILLWEIVTLGSTPYPGMNASEVIRRVKGGYRLDKPNHCRREIYNIMFYCWYAEQDRRPSFPELVQNLDSLILTEVEYIHLDNFPDHNYYNFSSVSSSGELL